MMFKSGVIAGRRPVMLIARSIDEVVADAVCRLQDFLSQARVTFVPNSKRGNVNGAEAQEASPWTSPVLRSRTYRSRVVTYSLEVVVRKCTAYRIWPAFSTYARARVMLKSDWRTQLVLLVAIGVTKDGSPGHRFIATGKRAWRPELRTR